MSNDTQATAHEMTVTRNASLRLAMVNGIGPRIFQNLLTSFSSPQAVLEADVSQLKCVPGVGARLAKQIAAAREEVDVTGQLEICEENQIDLIVRGEDNYPAILNEIHDPPNVLFCNGRIQPQDRLAVAIVGTRHATTYGLKTAANLARGLSLAGFTIVSGMARGIDAAAHRGALESGGRTIAVLGSGLLNVYPPEHATLSEEIAKQGAVLSEYLPMQAPRSGAFPQRNRIVSGLSLGVIVVEAAERSGALISARLAGEQGREVFAVPGRIDNRMSKGCHSLIRDGAKLVESVDDILEELGPLTSPATTETGQTVHRPSELSLNEQEKNVLQHIGTEPECIDVVIRASGLPASRVLATISVLEIRRIVRRVVGNKVVRA
ncbi:MAG: DNA-processing protein DprA [Planctomycetota bacterium]